MSQFTINSKELKKPNESFWKSIKIYVLNQHVVNRKLTGTIPLFFWKISNPESLLVEKCKQLDFSDKSKELIENVESLNIADFEDIILNHHNSFCYGLISKILPRNLNKFSSGHTLTILDLKAKTVEFFSLDVSELLPDFSYKISYKNQFLTISTSTDQKDSKSALWLKNVLFPKLEKWIENSNDEKSDGIKSLNLIDMEEYNKLYSELKTKYGTEMVKIWPENTDPAKFVYEDVAIATYLIILWKKEREKLKTTKLQSFVDLGCGNGLLVHLLSSEGHHGYGIDLRKRGIWDLFPKTTILKVETIIPSNKSIFPEISWILGNHSDELSPWIPVIAARNNFQTNFFVLPCCAYEFNGKKYQRRNGSKSQYNCFMDYVVEISEKCGFRTEVDRLRIPSTKRVCVIGFERTYEETEFQKFSNEIQNFIDERTKSGQETDNDFKPREVVEKVRNCTLVDRSIVDNIVQIVFSAIMAKKRYLDDYPEWNAGGIIQFSDLIKLIPQESLKKLKSECGGLQTLLKNNHQIFQVIQGKVQLKFPLKTTEKVLENKNLVFKKKECWFLKNHPNGCPQNDEECCFKH